jgi:hypothetical protein
MCRYIWLVTPSDEENTRPVTFPPLGMKYITTESHLSRVVPTKEHDVRVDINITTTFTFRTHVIKVL